MGQTYQQLYDAHAQGLRHARKRGLLDHTSDQIHKLADEHARRYAEEGDFVKRRPRDQEDDDQPSDHQRPPNPTSTYQGQVNLLQRLHSSGSIDDEDKVEDPGPSVEENNQAAGQQDGDLQSDPGEMFNRIMELDGEENGEASAQDFVDPNYVKESKRGLMSRMFRGRQLSKKPTRGFGDRLKSIGSGLASFGAMATFGLFAGALNLGFRGKKAYHKWRKGRADQKTKDLVDSGGVPAEGAPGFEDLARKRFKHERKEEWARKWQMKTGYFGSGYGWRKRMGWETNAERFHNSRVAGGPRYRDSLDSEGGGYVLGEAPDWRDARDTAQAVETGGKRFNRDKMARTKQVLALREQLAQLEKQKEQNPAAAAEVEQKLADLKEQQAAAEDGLKRVTTKLNTRLTKNVNNRSSRMSLRGGGGDLVNNLDLEDESVKTKLQAPATVLAPKAHALAENAIVEEDESEEEKEDLGNNGAHQGKKMDYASEEESEDEDDSKSYGQGKAGGMDVVNNFLLSQMFQRKQYGGDDD
jgi:hypothetical protein